MKKIKQRIQNSAQQFGCSLNEDKLEHFADYIGRILFWNRIAGITAHRTEDEIADYMFIDSLAVFHFVELLSGTICDFGTGGGFPGMPVKIARPELNMTLLDSSVKKCDFLKNLISFYKISDCRVLCERGENIREKFDVVLTRACRDFKTLAQLICPILSDGGVLISWKGASWKSEMKEASFLLKKAACSIEDVFDYSIPSSNAVRSLIVIKKKP